MLAEVEEKVEKELNPFEADYAKYEELTTEGDLEEKPPAVADPAEEPPKEEAKPAEEPPKAPPEELQKPKPKEAEDTKQAPPAVKVEEELSFRPSLV